MTLSRRLLAVGLVGGAAGLLALTLHARHAEACGCFAQPDPSVPIIQAGERILFSVEDGVVTAHIQVQYSGPAEEFGWLVPMPSIPEIDVGTDELFAQLITTTQPQYRLNQEFVGDCPFDPTRGGGFGSASDADAGGSGPPSEGGEGDVLVLRDSVGPYDYAVLRADDKEPMLAWLDENDFFVPANSSAAIDQYINPGAYFVAVKLLKSADVGDLQPIVVRYASDLPMIPIVLTSIGAEEDMPINVWVLGEHRAIPRNYFHTKINDAQIDWLNFGANYVDVIIDATHEADGRHSFVTEYAGTSQPMLDILVPQGRFGDLTTLASINNAVEYIEYMNNNGWPVFDPNQWWLQGQYSGQILGILQRHLPVPSKLLEQELVTPNEYYLNISYYLGFHRDQNPDLYTDLDLDFDPFALTVELEERVVDPTVEANELFKQFPYMTRLFTTLSPQEMTKDPVFSFNPHLPDVSNIHTGRIIYYCGIIRNDSISTTPAKLVTEDGWELVFPNGTGVNPWADFLMPWSRYTEILREEGQPEVVYDNTALIASALYGGRSGGGGCSIAGAGSAGSALALLGIALVLGFRRRRR